MVESAAPLVGEVLPRLPMRQWVLSVPFELQFLFVREPHLIHKVGVTSTTVNTGIVTLS